MKSRFNGVLAILLCAGMIVNSTGLTVLAEGNVDASTTISANGVVLDVDADNELIEELELGEEIDFEAENQKKVDPYLEERLGQREESVEVLDDGTVVENFSGSDEYNDHLLGVVPEAQSDVYKEAYAKIVDGMANFADKVSIQVTFPKSDETRSAYGNDVKAAYADALYSNIDFCIYDDFASLVTYSSTSRGMTTATYTVTLACVDDPGAMRKAVRAAYREVVRDGMSELEIILALHDYLCLNNTYDYTYSNYSAYNALVDRTSVCQGYYEAYKLLLAYQGLPSASEHGGNHVWNQVYVNGKWYNVDCTWDSQTEGYVSHYNFMCSDTKIKKNHTLERQDNYCTDTSYDNSKWYGNTDSSNGFMSATRIYYTEYISGSSGAGTVKLHVKNPLTGADSVVKTCDGAWVFSSGGRKLFWNSGSFVRMWTVNGLVYFNDAHSVYCINADGTITTLATFNSNYLIFGLDYYTGVLTVKLKYSRFAGDGINDQEKSYTISIPYYSETTNPTQIEQFVNRMYTIALGRQAESKGLAYWSTQLSNLKQDGAAISNGFLTSAEFNGRGLNNSAYLDVLYRTFFNREPDADGKNYWMQQLAGGANRIAVLSEFVNSHEFADVCDSYGIARGTMQYDGSSIYNPGVRNYVLRMYTKALGRQGETYGVEYWTNLIVQKQATPTDVAVNFFFSKEYQSKQLNDRQYLETLYQTFMDRSYDAEGLNYWLNYMARGMTREQVLVEFANSPEFRGIMASYGM